jgi:hypothetical protein
LINTLGINSIFNLQERGEHAGCGEGNEESGYSYDPLYFMDNNVFFYSFGWPDMTCPSLDFMLNVVQVMSSSLEDGKKIGVHCHAGLGRTGLSIACLLLYKDRIKAEAAVLMVREARPGSIQTRKQTNFVNRFEQYLAALRIAFPPRIETVQSKRLNLQTLILRQRLYTHGMTQRLHKFVPRIINVIMKKLLQSAANKDKRIDMFDYLISFDSINYKLVANSTSKDIIPQHVMDFEKEVNEDVWIGLEAEENPCVLIDVILYWLHSLKVRVLFNSRILSFP